MKFQEVLDTIEEMAFTRGINLSPNQIMGISTDLNLRIRSVARTERNKELSHRLAVDPKFLDASLRNITHTTLVFQEQVRKYVSQHVSESAIARLGRIAQRVGLAFTYSNAIGANVEQVYTIFELWTKTLSLPTKMNNVIHALGEIQQRLKDDKHIDVGTECILSYFRNMEQCFQAENFPAFQIQDLLSRTNRLHVTIMNLCDQIGNSISLMYYGLDMQAKYTFPILEKFEYSVAFRTWNKDKSFLKIPIIQKMYGNQVWSTCNCC